MKKVYVAGPISSGKTEQSLRNLRNGIVMGAKLLNLGFSPYVPHLDYQYNMVQDTLHIDAETYYEHDLQWLAVCDCMVVLPDYQKSKGVLAEIKFARERDIPVYYGLEALIIGELCLNN